MKINFSAKIKNFYRFFCFIKKSRTFVMSNLFLGAMPDQGFFYAAFDFFLLFLQLSKRHINRELLVK
jgi:hypothetical protein